METFQSDRATKSISKQIIRIHVNTANKADGNYKCRINGDGTYGFLLQLSLLSVPLPLYSQKNMFCAWC